LARENYFLQLTFFNHVIYPEALPDYLSQAGMSRIRKTHENLEIKTNSYKQALEESNEGQFNKFHLSNLGDWMDKDDYAALLMLIYKKSADLGRINSRFIYYNHPIPNELINYFSVEEQLGKMLSKKDKYPFYGLAPIVIDKRI
jgi:S-adenosylmethionine:diacylglycerol 3-amino-3-carboxypropyl transferase